MLALSLLGTAARCSYGMHPLGAVSSSKRILESGGAALGLIGVGAQDEALGAGGGFFSQLWGEKSATQRWVNGEMTNFEVCAVRRFPFLWCDGANAPVPCSILCASTPWPGALTTT